MQGIHTITYHCYRLGKNRARVECYWLSNRVSVFIKMDAAGAVDSLDARFDNQPVDAMFPMPFASLPPMARAMVRGVAEAALWEIECQRLAGQEG